ncbi:hypothetical protein ACUNWD_14095 [Sunxiuqinia sp. A32]|uniref:hypothetical protein n=1 Tax=Sunxiuqinia sp. A32 TaxID=3461496 RepID=UPI004045E40C
MKKNSFSILLLAIVTGILLFILFKPVLQSPNGILYGKTIDPIKSYYNFGYYLKYDSGIKHNGINYPYGDHLQYINSHPFFLSILKFVDSQIYPIANYGVAILNLCMILSFLIGIPFLFLILRRFKLPAWYAFLIALILGFLNPQFDRIHGHFEMVYWFFIPVFWYLLIRYRENKRQYLWAGLLAISGIIGGFISAYFAALYCILILGVLLADLFLHRKELRKIAKPGIQLFILAIIPIIAVKGLVGLTDWIDDRPTNPYGFYVYHSNIFSIFLPSNFPFKAFITKIIDINYQWEGRTFVGLPATIIAIIFLLKAPISWIRKQKPDWSFFNQQNQFQPYLIAGILVLLFSMCFPFKWGFGFLLDIITPIKQFRALGRFSWIFYYIFTVYTALIIYQYFSKLKPKFRGIPAYLLLLVVFLSWGFSAKYNIDRATRNVFNVNDKLSSDDAEFLNRFETAKIDPAQFQAIFALPFASTCGDKLLFENGTTALVEAMKCSYHTGLPLVQSFSPRLSFSQALSSIQMLADSAIQKTRLDDMNDRPLLLITSKSKLTEQEKWMASNAIPFWEDEYITMSKLPIEFLKESHQNWMETAMKTIPELLCENSICSDTSSTLIYYNGFENNVSKYSFSGDGAIYQRRGEVEIFNDQLPVDTGMVDLSFWLYFDTRMYDMPQPILTTYNSENQIIQTEKLNNRQVHDIFRNWVRISTKIRATSSCKYQVKIKGKYITVDDLLIKPADSNVFIETEGKFNLFNNSPISR